MYNVAYLAIIALFEQHTARDGYNYSYLNYEKVKIPHMKTQTTRTFCLYNMYTVHVQSTLAISNSDISNSATLEASICIKNTFWLLFPVIIWRWGLFCKFKLPEVQIKLHFG